MNVSLNLISPVKAGCEWWQAKSPRDVVWLLGIEIQHLEAWLKELTAEFCVVGDLICFWQRTGQKWKKEVQWELLSKGLAGLLFWKDLLNLHNLHEDLRWPKRYLDPFHKVPSMSNLILLMFQLYGLTSVCIFQQCGVLWWEQQVDCMDLLPGIVQLSLWHEYIKWSLHVYQYLTHESFLRIVRGWMGISYACFLSLNSKS